VYNNRPLAILCHVVYATLGLIQVIQFIPASPGHGTVFLQILLNQFTFTLGKQIDFKINRVALFIDLGRAPFFGADSHHGAGIGKEKNGPPGHGPDVIDIIIHEFDGLFAGPGTADPLDVISANTGGPDDFFQ
jgi:hypothetical protein